MELYILSALLYNHFGALTRVTNLFSRRGYNIKELTVGETQDPTLSRVTIVTEGDEQLLQQIQKQVVKLYDVKAAQVLPFEKTVSRELLLIKFRETKELYTELRKTPGRIMDGSDGCVIVELTGETDEINQFIEMMKDHEILEICRTGATALQKGANHILELSGGK